MNEIGVLSIRTSLPKVCKSPDDFKMTVSAYDSFEKAKTAMREAINKYAFSKNAMFNGAGQIKLLKSYIKEMGEPEEGEDLDGLLTPQVLSGIQDALQKAFAGENVAHGIKCGKYTDWMLAVTVKKDSVRFCGYDDGPCNGYDPVLSTNIFSMEKEQDYYLYITDLLGQDDYTSELYIDLKKATFA